MNWWSFTHFICIYLFVYWHLAGTSCSSSSLCLPHEPLESSPSFHHSHGLSTSPTFWSCGSHASSSHGKAARCGPGFNWYVFTLLLTCSLLIDGIAGADVSDESSLVLVLTSFSFFLLLCHSNFVSMTLDFLVPPSCCRTWRSHTAARICCPGWCYVGHA